MNKQLIGLYGLLFMNNGFTAELGNESRNFDGYSVAIKNGAFVGRLDLLNLNQFLGWVDSVRPLLAENACIGGWVDGDNVYLDVVYVFKHLSDAMQAAKIEEQLAVWDFSNGVAINVI